MKAAVDSADDEMLRHSGAIHDSVSAADVRSCPVARYEQARHPELMPFTVKDLPTILLVLFGISITPRKATDFATQRRLGFAKCRATGRLSTTMPRIKAALSASDAPDVEASPTTGPKLKRRRGRPRGSTAAIRH